MTAIAAVPPGLRYMALGAFWFSVMSLLVKAVCARLPSMEVVLTGLGVPGIKR